MATKKKKAGKKLGFRIDLFAVLKVFVSIFFIFLGIAGIVPGVGESIFSLNRAYTLELLFGVVELICGLFLLLSLFTFIPKKTVNLVTLIILIFWIVRIVLSKVLMGMPQLPLVWFLLLSNELIVATTIAILYFRKD